ncbi:MAG: diguanylate cyclase [Nitrospirota bacterium]|nr:diguanylate cyclase [Nitrospirota bacterium]
MPSEGRVLVVDDQPANVKIIAKRLSVLGYEVLTATNGMDGIRLARESAPDVILLDIMMPEMDGYEVIKRLKQEPETSGIPIALLTALDSVKDKVRGLDAGADDFLTKPVNQIELVARIRSLTKLKRLQEEIRKAGDLTSPLPEDAGKGKTEDKKIIFIVEDDEKMLAQYKRILDNTGEYRTLIANNASDALDVLHKTIPDLILLDIMLPDMNGIELLGKIRKEHPSANIPIIIISTIADIETKVKGIEAGADDYLIKPVDRLEMLARIRANLRKSEAQRRLKSNLEATERQAITDPLTGLYNRQYLKTAFEREIARARRYKRPFSMLILDIDHFKDVNDTFGHLAGDGVLREIAGILKDGVRASDVAARYGGEEFVVVLTDTNINGAVAAAEHLRKTVAQHGFAGVDGRQITISIGCTEFHPEDVDMDAVIKKADNALYKAKAEGRNRVKES